MENNQSNVVLWGGVLIAIVIATVALFHQNPAPVQEQVQTVGSSVNGGNVSDFTAVNTDAGYWIGSTNIFSAAGLLVGGSSGDRVSKLNTGTCYIRPYATTIAASSTAQVDCQATALFQSGPGSALAGITRASNVLGTLGTSTQGTLFGGLRLNTLMGSTTAGWITLFLENDTGATYTWSVTANASGTLQYISAN